MKTDKFAVVSKVWGKFIVTDRLIRRCVDSQINAEVRRKYIPNSFPYFGKNGANAPNISLIEFVLYKTIDIYVTCERNTTTDNISTSLPLPNRLLAKKTPLVAIIRANRSELLKIASASKCKN